MRKLVKIVFVNVLVILGLLFLIEGMVSYFTIGQTFFNQKISERKHTEYDEELGWINLPNVFISDMYSREDPLTINSQRYRSTSEFSVQVPAGNVRIICSGDSFTLGFGVDDDHTWCQQLTALDSRLETINMGQGGYGVDQAWLWYKRDQKKLEHDIVLFAFISEDFTRMESDSFMGYGKPYLTVRDDELIQDNYPVPRRSYDVAWWQVNLPMWQQLDTIKFLNKKFGQLLPQGSTALETKDHGKTDGVVAKIFASLHTISRDNQRLAVLVYLPTRNDIVEGSANRWRQMVQAQASEQGYHLIDVAQEMSKLPPADIDKMFRRGGHYTDEGNRFVAEVLYNHLRRLIDFPPSANRPSVSR